MTDPEVLELRYPVRLEEFSVRHGSGGQGRWRGGVGVVRRIRFMEPMTANIVSSRRTQSPFGLGGGGDGITGRQWVERSDGTREILPGTGHAELGVDDVFVIETPGGGGYGSASDNESMAV
jgi:5-oxoprolinase (ATP-hydrolysing)